MVVVSDEKDPAQTNPVRGIVPRRPLFTSLTMIFGSGAALIGMLGIFGLISGISLLSSFFPGYKSIAFSACIIWIIFGFVLAIHAEIHLRGSVRTCVAAIIALIAILSALEFPLNILGKHFIVEIWAVRIADAISAQSTSYISPVAVALLIPAAIALFFLLYAYGPSKEEKRARDIVGILGLTISLVSFIYVLSYLYHVPFLYDTPLIPISFPSTIATLCIGAGLVTGAGPRAIPLKHFTGPTTRARLLRFFLPLTLVIVLVQTFLMVTVTSYFDINNAILLSASVVVFSIVTMFVVARVSGGVSYAIDRAERELQDSNVFLSSLIDQSPTPTWISDEKGTLIRINKACCELLNITEDDVVGKYNILSDNIVKEQGFLPLVLEIFDKGQIARFRISYDTRMLKTLQLDNRASVILDVTIFPIKDTRGKITNAVIQHLNVTDRVRAEKALRESEDLFRLSFELASIGKSLTSPDGMLKKVNRAFCDMLGYSESELQAKGFAEITYPDDLDESIECVRSLLADERQTYRMDKRYIRKDGTLIWTDVSTMLLKDSLGKPLNFVTDIVNITERKRAEEALRETNAYLRNLLDYANAPIIVWDPQFRITRFNHAFERLTGRTESEVIGQHLQILFPDVSRNTSLDQIKKTLAGERWEVVEIPILHVSSETRTVLWNSANIIDLDGKIISTIAQGTDITERKRAEDALRESETSYRVLAGNLPGIVYRILLREDNRMIFFNDQLLELSGYFPEELTKGNICSIEPYIHPDDLPRVLAAINKALDETAVFIVEYRFRHRDGGWRYFVERGRVVTDQDAVPLYIDGVIHDISESKEAQAQRELLIKELEQKNAELERFTYTVSHDLKSPLITIKGFAGLIENDALKGDPLQLKKDIHRINAAADTMQELLSDILELARVGRVIAPPEKIPFGTIVHEAVDLLAGPLAERGVSVEIAPDLPVVNVDHARIREVMVNLIENAVKFSGDRPDPVIRIGVDTTGDTPVFFVRDNGIGIDPRFLERIFNLFERLDPSMKGTGIGLTIVRRIIEVNGGKIWAESEGLGKGTTIRFTLPVVV
ncbi:MAG: PAS domain S-box protein [Methanoregula sp.]|nr:MAG: PAS domain S-box protein [Methanoregula sp.]